MSIVGSNSVRQKLRIGLAPSSAAEARAAKLSSALPFARDALEISLRRFQTCEVHESLWLPAEAALGERVIDAALLPVSVLPLDLPAAFSIAAVLRRAPPEDALVTRSARIWQQLPRNAWVAAEGNGRRAALLRARPDLRLTDCPADVGDALDLLDRGVVDAIVVAAADLESVDLAGRVTQRLPSTVFTPSPAQGAVALVVRSTDDDILETLAPLDDSDSRLCVSAERTAVKALDIHAGAAAGVLAELRGRRLEISGKVWSPDGRDCAGATVAGDVLEDSRLAMELAFELALRGARLLPTSAKLHRAA